MEGISASVRYAEGGATGWLSLALAGTSAPTTLTVSSLLGALEEGTHEATLVLASQDDRVAQVTVPVRAVVVLDKPIIGLSSTLLEFRGEAAGAPPEAATVKVINQGGGILSDLQAMTLYVGVGGWLSAGLTGTTAPTELVARPDPSDLSPGTYKAEIRVAGPGALNTPASVDVTFTIDAGAVSPANSTAALPDGTAGSATDVVVQARDASGYALTSGGATVVMTVSGANAAGPITAADEGDGTYTASYTPTAAGTDRVAITMDGTPIGGSPLTSTVDPGSVSPAHSTATVPSGSVGSATSIMVRARDDYGNPLSSGGAKVVVSVSGANNPGALTVTDRGNGTYTASYTPTSAGTDQVAITMNGTPIGGSPFTSNVAPAGASPAHSTATVPDGMAGLPTDIVVQARNASGEPLSYGGATVAVTVSGANNPGALTVTDRGDGTYAASYTPTSTGTDQVAITMNGTPIGGSPFTSTVAAGSASPAHSTATVPDGIAGLPTEHRRPGQGRERRPLRLRGRLGGRDRVGGQQGRIPHGHRPGRRHLHRQLHAHLGGHRQDRDQDGGHTHQRQPLRQRGRRGHREPSPLHGQGPRRQSGQTHHHRGPGQGRLWKPAERGRRERGGHRVGDESPTGPRSPPTRVTARTRSPIRRPRRVPTASPSP